MPDDIPSHRGQAASSPGQVHSAFVGVYRAHGVRIPESWSESIKSQVLIKRRGGWSGVVGGSVDSHGILAHVYLSPAPLLSLSFYPSLFLSIYLSIHLACRLCLYRYLHLFVWLRN